MFAGAGLVSLLGIGALVQSTTAQVPTPQPPTPQPSQHRLLKGTEKHPEIRHAIRALERARMFLQHSSEDFGGHREKALDLTQAAIKECQLALQYDKK